MDQALSQPATLEIVLALALEIALAFVVGLMLGAFHSTGLWLTLRRLPRSPRPRLLFFGSLAVRLAVVVSGLLLFAGDDWQRLVVCLLGFLLARAAFARYWGAERTTL